MLRFFFLSKKAIKMLCLVGLFLTISCTTKKDILYFQNVKNFETIVDTDTFTPRFKINDIVSINVSAYNLESVKPFNVIVETGGTGGKTMDYLVDIDGNIDFPVLGKIKLLGLTVEEAKALLKEKLSDGYLKDPVINIRILNFRISILGAVGAPGVYTVSGERINILEAIATAGDLSMQGRRNDILVIRDFNGTKTYTQIDLTSKEVFNSPVYYLTQNDIVYVKPNNAAVSSAGGDARITQVIGYASFLISVALLVLR